MLPSVTIVDNKFPTVSFPSEEGDWTLWFSYKTLIAFQTADGKVFKRVSTWGSTARRHLRSIPDGITLSASNFEIAYQKYWGTVKENKS